jgi:hypothetical protein
MNVLMLNSQLHRELSQFQLIFEATGVARQNRNKTFPDTATGPIETCPETALSSSESRKGSWECPDPELLEIHACIGKFLHGIGPNHSHG